jgi:hypothetical protein
MSIPSAGRLRLRPLLIDGRASGQRGTPLAGGWLRFAEIAVETETGAELLPAAAVAALHPGAAPVLARLSRPRQPIGRLSLDRPHVVSMPDDPVAVGEDKAGLAAAWRAPDWAALRDGRRAAEGPCMAPPPGIALDGPAAVAAFLDRASLELDAAEAAGRPRSGIVIDLGAPAPAALGALAMLHGLGAPLLLHAHGDAARVAAVTVLAAGQGVQLIRAEDPAAAVNALDLWRAATA